MKAHQRIMREKIQKEEQEYSLLGKYWEQIDIDISKAESKR